MQNTIFSNRSHLLLSNTTTSSSSCPYVFIEKSAPITPIHITNRLSFHILKTISREMRAYKQHMHDINVSIFDHQSDPLSKWYQAILNDVFIIKNQQSSTTSFHDSLSCSFALPVSLIEKTVHKDTLLVAFKPPALWESRNHDHQDIHLPLSSTHTKYLIWIIPTDHRFIGTLISEQNKEGFQRLLSPKAFQ